jgi:uncharacterized protein
MDIRGSYLLPCDRSTAWAALDDPVLLKECLKGCEALTREDDGTYRGTVAAKIGPVAARFNGKMERSDVDEPRSCRMNFEGQGGVAGFARGTALVTLDEEAEGTRLSYVADTQVGGKLAQIGARLVEGSARSMADDFFGQLASRLRVDDAVSREPSGPAPAAASPGLSPQKQNSVNRIILISALVLVILIAGLWLWPR